MSSNREILSTEMKKTAEMTEKYIAETLSSQDDDLREVVDAMSYSLFAGGKRIRPFLTVAFCRLFGGRDEAALPFAAGIEMIHTFSLIHDDLPCMDDDDLRRGKPTNHKVFGEATALLAGDALALRASGVLASNPYVSDSAKCAAVRLLALASAEQGMVGGQIMDMYGEQNALPLEKLKKLQLLKTGALIKVSAMLGALAAGVTEEDKRFSDAVSYAERIGLAFQIKDDILDVTGDEKSLGKPIGSDSENSKTTFLTYMSVDEAASYAEKLTEQAKASISCYEGSEMLIELADYLLGRIS